MKIKVIVSFNDKTNDLINRPIGEIFECSKERAEELIGLGYAEEVTDEKPKRKTTKTA